MHSIKTKITAITVCGIVIAMIIATALGVNAIRNLGTRSADQTLLLLCEKGQKDLNHYFHSVEKSVGMVSAFVESDLNGLEDDELRSHLERVSVFFRKLTHNTDGVLTYYYRIDPAVSKNVNGFWFVRVDEEHFQEHEATDISLYNTEDTSQLVWFTVPKATGHGVWLPPYVTENLDVRVISYNMHANLLRAISHDIRTPLASILGASSALQEQELTQEDQKELIAGIQRDAKWLVRVTENLLSVTKVSSGTVKLRKEDEVLEEIIGSAILKYHQTAGSLPVSVEAPGEIIMVPIDAMLIEQVLVNLFENVSIHAANATQIWLHISRRQNGVRISVEDDGPGIPEHLLPCVKDGTIMHSEQQVADAHRNMGIP